jgi:hypothetical protein
VTEVLLFFARFLLLALLYLFLFRVLRLLARDLPAPASVPRTPRPRPEELLAPAGPWLEAVSGAEQLLTPARLPLQGTLILGRAPGCQVRLVDPFASARHARLVAGPEGVVLEDLGSTNGTFLHGRRLSGPVRLREGDVFEVGDVAFRFHAGGS